MKRLGKGSSIIITTLNITVFLLFTLTVELSGTEPKTKTPSVKKLTPVYGGTLRIAEQYDGTSIGYPAKLTRIYTNETSAGAVKNGLIESLPVQYLSASPRNPMSEEAILAKCLDCPRHAVRHLTPEKLDTLTQPVLHMEDTKDINTITKNL